MQHQSHIGLINPHAERIGGHHHTAFSLPPALLALILYSIVQSGMVEFGCDSSGLEQFCNLLGPFAVAHIDNGTAVGVLHDVEQFPYLISRFTHHIGQILALEAHAEHAFFLEEQLSLDVFHHLRRGSGCEGQNGYVWQSTSKFCDFQVSGAKVVSPLGDAMALIYRDHADVHTLDLDTEKLCAQTLWGDIEELIVAI